MNAVNQNAAVLLSTGSWRLPQGPMLWNYLKSPRPAGKDNPGGKPKFEVTVLMPKSADLDGLDNAMWELALSKANNNERAAKRFKYPLRPITEESNTGDKVRDEIEKAGMDVDNFVGWYGIRSEDRPEVVDHQRNPVDWEDDGIGDVVYPGRWIRVTCRPFYYKNSGNEGISLALRNVQLGRLGVKMGLGGGKPAAKDEFEAMELDDAPAPKAGKKRPFDD